MRPISRALAIALVLYSAAPALAQVADHLQCYKVKDPQAKTEYTADLNGLTVAPGCTIKVPAKLACVPTVKSNVVPPAPETGGSGTPNVSFCYKVKCPKATLPAVNGTDQFGQRIVSPVATQFVCAPVELAPVTTTTLEPTTTTTTLPSFPSCPTLGDACGSCGDGLCVVRCPGPSCDNLTQVCVSTSSQAGSCTTDANCSGGAICYGTHGCAGGSCMSEDPFGGSVTIGTCATAGCP
jgi:hypothetical protein